jgi:hypothetical protein
MPVETESDLSISLPEGSSFRFAKTATYQRLGGRSLKEMDFGYFDEAKGSILLVELTSYRKATEAPKSAVLLTEMITKARDSLLMLQAAWRGHGEGKALAPELPQSCRKELRLRICFVMKLRPEHLVSFAMSDIRGRLKTCVAACAELLGLEVHVELFDHTTAMRKLPITEPPPSDAAGA